MARAATTKTPARKTRTKVEEAPRRKPGRPVGSTNVKRATLPAAKAVKPAVKRAAAAKPFKVTKVTKPAKAAAPKLSKAELELLVVKLERTITRLREKNKELKTSAPKAPAPAEVPAAKAPVEAKPPRKTRRTSKSTAPASDVESPSEA